MTSGKAGFLYVAHTEFLLVRALLHLLIPGQEAAGGSQAAHNGSLECHELTAITDPGTECSGDREPSLISVQCRIRKVTSSARSLR